MIISEIFLLHRISCRKLYYNSLTKREQEMCSVLRYYDYIEDYLYAKSDPLKITWKGKREISKFLYSAITLIIIVCTLIITIFK